MRNFILASVLILCLTLSICGGAFAAPITPEVSYDPGTGLLTVSGEADADAVVTLMVLKQGVVFDDTTKNVNQSDVLFFDIAEAADGTFAFEAAFQGTSGSYTASIADSKSGERYAFTVAMVNPTNYPTAIAALNTASAGDFTTVFKPAFEANQADLGFSYALGISDAALKLFQTYVAGTNLSADAYAKNLKLYQTFCVIGALKGGSISDITP